MDQPRNDVQETTIQSGGVGADDHTQHAPIIHNQENDAGALQSMGVNTQPSSVFFVFADDRFDKADHPIKIIIDKSSPTVQDVCATLQSLFFPLQSVSLSCSFERGNVLQEFPADSQDIVPVNDRRRVIGISTKFSDETTKMDPAIIDGTFVPGRPPLL